VSCALYTHDVAWKVNKPLIFILIACFSFSGCAEVTKPTPASHEVEAVQVTALTRHPHSNYSTERAMRVFLRLLPTLPCIHGRTYPFLGFNWWVTAAGHPVVDNVWYPSPAHDRPLKSQAATLFDPHNDRPSKPEAGPALRQGDLILAVNGLPIPLWVKDWDRFCQSLRDIFQQSFPGGALADFVLTARYARLETEGTYRGGPVTLLIDRQGVRKQVTLYPVHLPAEYGLLVVSPSSGFGYNALSAPGRILITSKLLNFCRTDDELAVVLGHELAHHAHGHQVRQMGQYPAAGLPAQVIALPFRLLPWLPENRSRNLSEDVRKVSRDAMISAYSRRDELEADAYGAFYAYQAGYDLEQGIYLWERLAAAVDRNVFADTYFLDAHPAAPERLARLKQIAQLYKAGQAAQVLVPEN
jgi:Zn-dependent protease with chaperone function